MKFAVASLALAGIASAHTTFQYFQVGGVDYGSSYIRSPSNNNPIENVGSADMACNIGGNSGKPNKATVPAGSTFTAEFHHEGRSSQGVDPSHKGPTIAYLAKVNDATTASASGLSWFKIHQDGLSGSTWAVDKFNANGGKWSFTIPSNIPNGDYLLRAETISLHSAGNYPGAQLYFGCAQITVTGAAGGNPSPTVSFPGAYSGSDPGIRVNIYVPSLNYVIPGPPIFGSSGGGGGGQPTTTSRPSTTTTTSRPPTTTPPSSGGAALWAQCGGTGFSGPSSCSQGTCVKVNDYYSQCQP